jgi:ABC-type glycerol-3-phosphate transport system substrate-binding protein
MFSFPFNSSTALLYWNKDAFQKIGKTEAPKTWEEAAADMKALKDAGYDCPLAFDISQDESWQLMEQFSAVHGEPIATKNNGFGGLDAELTFNKTKFVKFVTDLKSWYDEGLGQNQVAQHRRGLCRRLRLRPLPDDAHLGRRPRQYRPHRRSRHALGRCHAAGL